jgi:hypothetical protein
VKDASEAPEGVLSRWSRRKALLRQGEAPPEPLSLTPVRAEPVEAQLATDPTDIGAARTESTSAPAVPLPTLDDVAQLDPTSDFRRFVAPDVSPEVKNAALKKLFADPQFNVMDGLDTYIDDYGKPDPIPESMLRQMVQAKFLGLFDAEDDDQAKAAGAIPDGAAPAREAQSHTEPTLPIADDQNATLRLQPLDAAGPPGDPGSVEQDRGRER